MAAWQLMFSRHCSVQACCLSLFSVYVRLHFSKQYQHCFTKGFCYLGDRVNASSGCKAAVTARVRIGWVKFKECRDLLNSKRFLLKMKGMVYRSCVRSAMLYGSERNDV